MDLFFDTSNNFQGKLLHILPINLGFLIAYRNIFEEQYTSDYPLKGGNEDQKDREQEHGEGQGWTEDQVATIPLESDSEAIDYLARHNFNLDEAIFSLHCEVGCGKGMGMFWRPLCAAVSYNEINCRRHISSHAYLI